MPVQPFCGNGWKCQDNRLSGNPSHQSAGTVERLTGLSHWRSYKIVKLEERRLCPCVSQNTPVLIAHQFDTPGRVLVFSRNRGSPVRGCETTISCDICRSQRTRLTVQKTQLVESRGAVCRPHQFLLMEGYFAQSKTLHYSHRVNLMFLITENLDVVAICTNPQV